MAKEPGVLIATRYIVYGLCLVKIFSFATSFIIGAWYRIRPHREEIVAIIPNGTLSNCANYLIAIAIFGVLITFLLLLGTLNDNKFFLGFYSFLNLVFLIVTTTFIISVAIYSLMIDSLLSDQMRNSLESTYTSREDPDSESRAWNLLQVRFGCCGVTGPDDWLLSRWSRGDESNVTINGYNFKAPFPSPCCYRPSKNSLDDWEEISQNDLALCYAPSPNNHVPTRGCAKPVERFLKENIHLLIGVKSVIMCLLLFGFILSLILVLVDWQEIR